MNHENQNPTAVSSMWRSPMKSFSRVFSPAVALGLVIVALSGGQFLAQGTDPILGTWELNVAQSKYSPGPPLKSQTRTYILAGDAIKATVKGIGSDGKPTSAEWTMSYDGQDRPLNGNPNADTVSLRRIDPYKVEFTLKRAGKVVITGTRTISKDGKTMTLAASGITAAGQNLNEVEVFEKR
jgi:hypothetical protein